MGDDRSPLREPFLSTRRALLLAEAAARIRCGSSIPTAGFRKPIKFSILQGRAQPVVEKPHRNPFVDSAKTAASFRGQVAAVPIVHGFERVERHSGLVAAIYAPATFVVQEVAVVLQGLNSQHLQASGHVLVFPPGPERQGMLTAPMLCEIFAEGLLGKHLQSAVHRRPVFPTVEEEDWRPNVPGQVWPDPLWEENCIRVDLGDEVVVPPVVVVQQGQPRSHEDLGVRGGIVDRDPGCR